MAPFGFYRSKGDDVQLLHGFFFFNNIYSKNDGEGGGGAQYFLHLPIYLRLAGGLEGKEEKGQEQNKIYFTKRKSRL